MPGVAGMSAQVFVGAQSGQVIREELPRAADDDSTEWWFNPPITAERVIANWDRRLIVLNGPHGPLVLGAN